MRRSKNYRKIWELANGKEIPKGYHVHHLDGNRTNDNPENLVCVSPEEHAKLHEAMGHKICKNFILTSNNRKGIPRSDKDCRKISEAKRGIATVVMTDEIKLKMAKSHGARPFVVEKSGKIVGEWICISQAARALGINRGNLSSCLAGKIPHVSFFTARFK
jgi:hypothetical protein